MIYRTAYILFAAVIGVASPALAQGPGAGGRVFDAKTVETLSGVVQRIDHVQGPGKGYGVHLLLKTDKEEIEVHLGPGWYIDKQALKIAVHDALEVRGSRVELSGKPVIIAAEVKKGDQTLVLRSASGVPAWQGQGKGKGPQR